MKVAFANERGGAGRTACALLLTLGLVELGRRVTYAEFKFGDAPSPAFSAGGLPFDYKAMNVRSIDHLFSALRELHADTPPSSDLILDLPAIALRPSWGNARLLEHADILLVPFRRAPADIATAVRTWLRLRALSMASSRADCRTWMLPVGWTNAASAARAAAACLKTADLPRDEHSPVLPWSVPRLTLLHQRWLRDWRVHSIRSAALEGIVVGHPALRDGPVRTSTLFYCDKELTFARTLSRYYRLGRPAGEGET